MKKEMHELMNPSGTEQKRNVNIFPPIIKTLVITFLKKQNKEQYNFYLQKK